MNHNLEEEEWDQPQVSMVAQTTWAKRLKKTLIQHWQPKPVSPPVVDDELPHLSSIERSAEVCRFNMSKMEHSLSPMGHLREFIRFNIRLAVAIAVPLLMVAPLVTMAITQFKEWIAMLTATFSSFILFPLSVVLSILLVAGMIYIGRSILEMRIRSNRRDPYGY